MDCFEITRIIWSICALFTMGFALMGAGKIFARYTPESVALVHALISTLLPH